MKRFLLQSFCLFVLVHGVLAADRGQDAAGLDTALERLDTYYATELKNLDKATGKRLKSIAAVCRTQLKRLLTDEKVKADKEYSEKIEVELLHLENGHPTDDPDKYAGKYPELNKIVAARILAEQRMKLLKAQSTVDLARRIGAGLGQMESQAKRRDRARDAELIKGKITELMDRAEVKAAQERVAARKHEEAKQRAEARRREFLEKLAAGKMGPFAPRAPDAGWRPRLSLGKAWQRMQDLDCDYSVFEYFSGRSVEQLLPQVSNKPVEERVRYLLYMLFSRLDVVNAQSKLKSFPPKLVIDQAAATFWPVELYPARAEGALVWTARASFVRDGKAHNILQFCTARPKDVDELFAVNTYGSATVPEKGWASVSPSSYLRTEGEGPR